MTTLQKTSCYNPFFLNGKEISFIEFTQNGKPIGCVYRGWFGGSNNSCKELQLPFEIKNKRVYSNKVESFLIKVSEYYKTGYKLVIPCELLEGFNIERHVSGYKSKSEHQFFDRITFTALADKLEYIKDDVKGVVRKTTGLKRHTIAAEFNFTFEKTEVGIRYKNLSDAAETVGVNLSTYKIEQLEKVFNITLK